MFSSIGNHSRNVGFQSREYIGLQLSPDGSQVKFILTCTQHGLRSSKAMMRTALESGRKPGQTHHSGKVAVGVQLSPK